MNKTALVLGGGGSRGAYEIGVWKALNELDIRIDIITGTSVGAINGAMAVQGDIDLAEKLWQQLETEMIFDVNTTGIPAEDTLVYAKEIIMNGGAESTGLRRLLENYIDEDRIRNSALEYGLVVTQFPSMEAEYLYKEDIPTKRLIDYILASASCYPAVQKCIINDQKYIDGGYRDNVPIEMAISKGADAVIAVDLEAAGFTRKNVIEEASKTLREFKMIKSPLSLGNFLIFDTANTSRILQLGYLDTMRAFGKYDGEKYTFEKGLFNIHELAGADNAAFILRLDPCKVYNRKTFTSAAYQQLDKATNMPDNLAELVETRLDELKILMNDFNIRTQLMLHIAESLSKEQEESSFLQPAVFKILKEEIQAANFLINNNLL